MRPLSNWSMRIKRASQSDDRGADGLGESEQVRMGRVARICQQSS